MVDRWREPRCRHSVTGQASRAGGPGPGASVSGYLAAVDVHDLACDVGRRLEEEDAGHDVADLADPSERGEPVAEPRVAFGRVYRCLDDARRDSVDADAAGGVLDGQRPGGRVQSALC